MKFKEHHNKIYVNLRSVTLPATVTNKGSHVANGLVDDLIKTYEMSVRMYFQTWLQIQKKIICVISMDILW
jgi:hypothetical protein